MLSFVLNQGRIGDYREENKAPDELHHTIPFVGGGVQLGLCQLAEQPCAWWLPPVGTACGQHRTQSGVPGSGVDG